MTGQPGLPQAVRACARPCGTGCPWTGAAPVSPGVPPPGSASRAATAHATGQTAHVARRVLGALSRGSWRSRSPWRRARGGPAASPALSGEEPKRPDPPSAGDRSLGGPAGAARGRPGSSPVLQQRTPPPPPKGATLSLGRARLALPLPESPRQCPGGILRTLSPPDQVSRAPASAGGEGAVSGSRRALRPTSRPRQAPRGGHVTARVAERALVSPSRGAAVCATEVPPPPTSRSLRRLLRAPWAARPKASPGGGCRGALSSCVLNFQTRTFPKQRQPGGRLPASSEIARRLGIAPRGRRKSAGWRGRF